MTWLAAFEGIPRFAGTSFAAGNLPDNLARRGAVRKGAGNLILTVGELRAIADRIDTLSRALVEAQGAGPVLDADALERYEAEQALAERAAAKTGTLAEDLEGDWAGLYSTAGVLTYQGHVSDVRDHIVHDCWAVVRIDAPCGDDGFPAMLGELKRALIAAQREAT